MTARRADSAERRPPVTIVWIASRFTEEHRSTLDWLNRITDESFRFFGLEVELWRIGESSPAPKFNIVSKPNDWSQSVAQAARAIDDAELSETRVMQRAYWTAFDSVLVEFGGPVRGGKKPQPQAWMAYGIGRTGITLNASMARPKRQVRAELYLSGRKAKAFFHLLASQKDDIERELGSILNWEELPDGLDSRISFTLEDTDVQAEVDWKRQHQWLAERLNQMHRIFAPRIRALDPTDWRPATASDDPNDGRP